MQGNSASTRSSTPDYAGLVRFLVQPFLETPDSLKVDCEINSRARVWVRLAFEGADKGRVFGRGGRNIQAIRSVLEGVAKAAGHSAYLDIYGSQNQREGGFEERSEERSPRRPSPSRSVPKPRSKPSEE
jgi:uncharacterized protein